MYRPLVLICATLGLAMGVEATAVLFEGPNRTGALTVGADGRMTLAGAALDLSGLDRLVVAGETIGVTGTLGLWLSDGSWMPITAVGASATADHVVIKSSLGEVDLPLSAVRGWGEQLPAAGDKDVVVLASGSYPARINGISNGQLAFSGELGDVTVAVAEILALRLAGADRAPRGLTLAATLDPARPALQLVPGPTPHLAVAPDVALTAWPVGRELRVEGGRRVYLGALVPATVKEEGAFGVVWPHVIDANCDHEPLMLGGMRFAHGVSLHSQCTLAWQVDGAYQRLRALVGIADEVRPEGDCPVSLLGDGAVLWQSARLTGRDKPQAIDVSLEGVKRLEIRITFGNRYDIGDRVAFADAYLVRMKK